jgi:restriction system protein
MFAKPHAQGIAHLRRADIPTIVLQALVIPGSNTDNGVLIEAVAIPWFKIVDLIQKDPSAIHQINWRAWEEIIAGAYTNDGFEVILTPRSNDKGRDVIATRHGVGSIRVFDQVKAYAAHRVVTAEEVRAMVGVLAVEGNVSKGDHHYNLRVRSRSSKRREYQAIDALSA